MVSVTPFATTAGDEDVKNEDVKPDGGKSSKQKKAKAKAKPKKISKKAKKVIADEEMERELCLVDASCEPQHSQKQPLPGEAPLLEEKCDKVAEPVYVAKKFAEIRQQFLADCKKKGHKYHEANKMWMLSDDRSNLLSGLSPSELKRRRFC